MFREDGSKSVVFVLVVLTFFFGKTSSNAPECAQLTPCSCVFPNGQGYNVTHLASSGPLMAPTTGNRTFQFLPCKNTQIEKNSECYKGDGVSMCLVNGNNTSTSVSLGMVNETSMAISPMTGNPLLLIHHNSYTTTVELMCCGNCSTHLTAEPIVDNLTYNLLLVSPFACKHQLYSNHGLSTGSLLLIYFFIFTGIYFTGGAIALNLLRGARGWEMVPNHKFWRDLPSLVRDGIEFTFGCYSSSYNRI
ncbi:uncharacterized protein LOC143359228 [Halictus rubicundus]|uniref:uncharacterized protein LOC143359228 n=1 Tax=Halictus rubicundus TaxID=77578 RepID=UPI004036CD49